MVDKLEHNIWIAHALNYAPVSMILLTVKAVGKIDNTLTNIRNYAERFQDEGQDPRAFKRDHRRPRAL